MINDETTRGLDIIQISFKGQYLVVDMQQMT